MKNKFYRAKIIERMMDKKTREKFDEAYQEAKLLSIGKNVSKKESWLNYYKEKVFKLI